MKLIEYAFDGFAIFPGRAIGFAGKRVDTSYRFSFIMNEFGIKKVLLKRFRS